MAQADLSRPPVVPIVPADQGNARATSLRFANAINQALRGTLGATMGVTLVANATQSSFADSRIGPYTSIMLMPATGHAADVLPSTWFDTTKEAVTIHHANVPYTDLTYVALLIG